MGSKAGDNMRPCVWVMVGNCTDAGGTLGEGLGSGVPIVMSDERDCDTVGTDGSVVTDVRR